MSFYGDFTIEEAKDIGKEFKAICAANYGYEGQLTEGKEYIITIEPRIMPMSPLCSFINDKGNKSECHLTRFRKIKTGDINMKHSYNLGDIVAYSAKFLRSIADYSFLSASSRFEIIGEDKLGNDLIILKLKRIGDGYLTASRPDNLILASRIHLEPN